MTHILDAHEANERGCWLSTGCVNDRECLHRAQCASRNPQPSSDGKFSRDTLRDVDPGVFARREIDWRVWINLCNISAIRQVGSPSS